MKNQASTRSVRNRDHAEAGKHRSALTAFRHGLTGYTIVMLSEDLAAYQRFTKHFFDDLKPRGILEEQLVQSLADTSWRLNRIHTLENNLFALGYVEHPEALDNLAIVAALCEKTRTLRPQRERPTPLGPFRKNPQATPQAAVRPPLSARRKGPYRRWRRFSNQRCGAGYVTCGGPLG